MKKLLYVIVFILLCLCLTGCGFTSVYLGDAKEQRDTRISNAESTYKRRCETYSSEGFHPIKDYLTKRQFKKARDLEVKAAKSTYNTAKTQAVTKSTNTWKYIIIGIVILVIVILVIGLLSSHKSKGSNSVIVVDSGASQAKQSSTQSNSAASKVTTQESLVERAESDKHINKSYNYEEENTNKEV